MTEVDGTCTIGRVGLAAAAGGDGWTFYEPAEITQTGRQVGLSGIQQESTLIKLMWRRDALLGLTDPASDPVIPVTFTSYTHLDGFYRINSVTADRMPAGLAWSVDLTRVSDWGHPRVEQFITYAVTTNSHGLTAGSYVVGAPGVPDSIAGAGIQTTRANADGFNQIVGAQNGVSAAATFTGRSQVQPGNWHKGGCRVELNLASGGTYYTAVGRKSFAVLADLARLRLQNGLVRATFTSTGPTIAVDWWDGSAWDTGATLDISDVTYGAATASGFGILRNTPEEVVVRIATSFATGGSAQFPAYFDVGLRRGSRAVTVYAAGVVTHQWRATINGGAMTAVSGGLRETSNNANGNRNIIVSNNGTTIDTANKRVTQASATTTPMLISYTTELAGSGSSGSAAAAFAQAELFISLAEVPMVAAL